MKLALLVGVLFSFNAVASDSYMLLARCSGEYEGEEMKLNVLVNDGYFCGKGNNAAQKGLIVTVDDFMGASEAVINFKAPKTTIKDLNGLMEITLDKKGAPRTTKAMVKMGTGGETEIAELDCDVPHYQMNCTGN